MPIELFAGIPVADLAISIAWYERLLGAPPSFRPNPAEAVWQLADHNYIFVELKPAHAGHARHLLFVDDLDTRLAQIAARGLTPAAQETMPNAVRKVTFRDPDGNEFGFGGADPQAGS
jgi:catechol 2,3-dioxygenase-like lactoylglutathione lyase family enzyme